MSKRCMLATVVAALLGLAPAVQAKTLCVDATAGSDAVTYAANDGATACWRTLGRAMWGTTNREARNGAEAAKAGDLVLVRGDHSAPGTGRRNDVAFLSENSGTPGNPIVYRAVGLGRWRWSLSGRNGERVAQGQGYTRRDSALRRLRRVCPTALIAV